jgi:hypothetical protein
MDKVFQILARPAGLSAAYALDAYAFSFGSEQVRSYHCAPKIYKILAHLGGESSKLLFKVLAEWNHALSHTSIASDSPPANGNALRTTVKSPKSQSAESLSENIIGVDLSVRRPPRPTDRSPKVRVPNDDSVEAGHG